jgi:hypothetical protein
VRDRSRGEYTTPTNGSAKTLIKGHDTTSSFPIAPVTRASCWLFGADADTDKPSDPALEPFDEILVAERVSGRLSHSEDGMTEKPPGVDQRRPVSADTGLLLQTGAGLSTPGRGRNVRSALISHLGRRPSRKAKIGGGGPRCSPWFAAGADCPPSSPREHSIWHCAPYVPHDDG